MKAMTRTMTKDHGDESCAGWLVQRSRGIRMPIEQVKDENYDRPAFAVMDCVSRSEFATRRGCWYFPARPQGVFQS